MRSGLLVLATLILAFADPTGMAQAETRPMTFTLGRLEQAPACGADCAQFIVAHGAITPGSAFGYVRARAKSGNRDLPIILQSPGGYVSGAIALAKGWRQIGATVIVADAFPTCAHEGRRNPCPKIDEKAGVITFGLGPGAMCASACTLAIAGATKRIAGAGARFGIHSPGIDPDSTVGQTAISMGARPESIRRDSLARATWLFREMDIDPALSERSGQTPYSDMEWLSIAEARRYRLVNATLDDLERDSPVGIILRAMGVR